MLIGNRDFDTENQTYIMGILNCTPDSFSDGGKWNEMDKALYHVEDMIEEGMDILDIGGESTRPGYRLLSDEEEIQRTVPVIEAVKSRFDIPVSLDTYKVKVAREGIRAGTDLVNDIWGLKYRGVSGEDHGEEMGRLIADTGVACCLMHNRNNHDYMEFFPELLTDLEDVISRARHCGIPEDRIILDPGVGFGKTYEHNLEVISRLEELHALGYPVLLGASRKSVIGNALSLPVEERLEGTLAATVLAVMKGCAFVRVHDVKANARAIRMTSRVMEYGQNK